MPIEENGHTSAYNEALRQIRAGLPEHFNFGKGFLEEEEAFKLANIQVAKPKEAAPNTNPIEIRVIGLHKFNGEQVFIVVDGLRYPAAYEPSSNTFLIYLYNTTSFNKIEAILYSKGAAIQRVERVFKVENETGIFSGSVEEDAGQSGFVTGEQFLNITKQQPTTVMALVGFNDKANYEQANSMYKGNLGYIVKNACKKAEEIYTSNGLNVRFYPLSLKEILPLLDDFNGLYVGFMGLNPFSDTNHGTTGSSRWTSSIGMGKAANNATGDIIAHTVIEAVGSMAYNLAHEYLHQWLGRVQYLLYKNLLHMQNMYDGHLNLTNFNNLNTQGDDKEEFSVVVFDRFNKKNLGFCRIWPGHLFILKNYGTLCKEIIINDDFKLLHTKLFEKLKDSRVKQEEYKKRIKEIKKGILMGSSDSPKSHALPNSVDYKFTDKEILDIIFNFQF